MVSVVVVNLATKVHDLFEINEKGWKPDSILYKDELIVFLQEKGIAEYNIVIDYLFPKFSFCDPPSFDDAKCMLLIAKSTGSFWPDGW